MQGVLLFKVNKLLFFSKKLKNFEEKIGTTYRSTFKSFKKILI